ncbi:MAG TPA: FKBP-type peptidyl-prolyl cis-trans isomerase [Nitrospira sp.]|nr:FKBP-type peptidyl-prolyl cis-trans isomerase [Nitrospira sp.]
MKRLSGVTLLEERAGEGTPAQKGDRLVYNSRIFLNKGEEVALNTKQAEHLPESMLRVEGGVTLVDHTIVLGRRQVIGGLEVALMGMKVGGYRKVRIGPHLAYREKGIPDLIPPHAVLVVELWLRMIIPTRKVHA